MKAKFLDEARCGQNCGYTRGLLSISVHGRMLARFSSDVMPRIRLLWYYRTRAQDFHQRFLLSFQVASLNAETVNLFHRAQPLCLRIRPIRQTLPLLISQSSRLVQLEIARQRHVSVPHCIGYVTPFFGGALGIIVRPLGKIQVLARIAHVAVQPPRNRSDVSIPWPMRLVGVAIITRRTEHAGNFCWRRIGTQQIVARRHHWRGVRNVGQLQQAKHRQRGQ